MNNMVSQGSILSVLLLGSILVLAQILSERGAFLGKWIGILSYFPI